MGFPAVGFPAVDFPAFLKKSLGKKLLKTKKEAEFRPPPKKSGRALPKGIAHPLFLIGSVTTIGGSLYVILSGTRPRSR